MKPIHLSKCLGIVILAGALSLSNPVEAVTLKVSHVRPQGTIIDVQLKEFAAGVEQATDGDVKIKVFSANALGDYTIVQERISLGAVDMAVQPAATAVSRKMQINAFPYLAQTWEQAREIYGSGGAINEVMKELYAEQDITMLAVYPVYFGGVALNREAVSPGDINIKKGIKVRVPAIKSFQLTGDALGYISSPLPFSDTFTAVQTGVVDGVIGLGAEGYYTSFRDVTKTYVAANTHFEVWYVIISSESLARLSADNRAALGQAAADFEARRWTTAESDQSLYEKKLEEHGTAIVRLSDQQLAEISKKIRAEVWPQILADIDAEWATGILEEFLADSEQ